MPDTQDKFVEESLAYVLNTVKENVMTNLHVADVCKVLQIIALDTNTIVSSDDDVVPLWKARTSVDGIEFGGYAANYYWDAINNPSGDFYDCLPNCTCYAYGRQLEAEGKPPVSRIVDAANWHKYVTNGWEAIPYDRSLLAPGDIVEWSGEANHVAVVESTNGDIYVTSSSYTGQHGVAYYDGGYDPRTPGVRWETQDGRQSPFVINSMRDISRWMKDAVPRRFFNYGTLDNEISWCGAQPDYILKNPGGYGGNSKNKYVCRSITTGGTVECRAVSNFQIGQNDIVVVLFIDRDYRANIDKALANQNIQAHDSALLHDESFGIIVGKL